MGGRADPISPYKQSVTKSISPLWKIWVPSLNFKIFIKSSLFSGNHYLRVSLVLNPTSPFSVWVTVVLSSWVGRVFTPICLFQATVLPSKLCVYQAWRITVLGLRISGKCTVPLYKFVWKISSLMSALFAYKYQASLWSSQMDKGKGKQSFSSLLISSHAKQTSGKINMDEKISGNITKSPNLPNLPPLSGVKTVPRIQKKGGVKTPSFDPTAMFAKLAAVRENGRKKKELTLVGFLVGAHKDFPRVFAKIRMDWKPIKGTLSFNVLKAGWFEIAFTNHVDFNLIWENRPYHIFSQPLLIKQWNPGFDPSTESISQLDLWVRFHYLPEEFANSEALETIIEGNCAGKFLKMDPTHNSERWNMYTRFCINTDVEKTFGRNVIVPDEHFNQIKFPLRFDDFSPGCGACGKPDHIYKDCYNKNLPTPMLQITIKKPSSKNKLDEDGMDKGSSLGDWNTVGKNNKATPSASKSSFQSNNIYLSEKGGINVIYESDDSDDLINQFMVENENFEKLPNLIPATDGLFSVEIQDQMGFNSVRANCVTNPDMVLSEGTNSYISPNQLNQGVTLQQGIGNISGNLESSEVKNFAGLVGGGTVLTSTQIDEPFNKLNHVLPGASLSELWGDVAEGNLEELIKENMCYADPEIIMEEILQVGHYQGGKSGNKN